MSGKYVGKMKHRDLAKELLELVHAEGYEPSGFREIRHILNVEKNQVMALQDAVATLLEQEKIRLGARERIFAAKARATRAERLADKRERKEARRTAKTGTEALPREGEGWKQRYEGPSWKQVIRLFTKAHELPGPFAKPVSDQAEAYREPSAKDFANREDCRTDDVCTIDPWNAHDHDDAVAVTDLPDGWRMDVHIADVSHYVTEGSPLDKSAVKRSFTTYLPWTAHTMLPENLAADLCSLLDGKDRLALSCRMEIGRDGTIRTFRFFESVVRVRRFLSYEQAQELADRGDEALGRLKACSETLLKRRREENLIEFDLPEPKVVFDDKGEPTDAAPSERLPSHRWIEEAMLAANRCCAAFLDGRQLPGLYRVHESPDPEALVGISNWARLLELPRWVPRRDDVDPLSNVQPRAQAWLAALVADPRVPQPLQTKVIRSMKKARYSPDCRGHFALGWIHYAHYTSPIRRYPDLWTHRVIKAALRGEALPSGWPSQARRLAVHVSGREDAVVKAERSGNKACAAWILRERLGDVFEGQITGVEAIGVFVQLSNPWAEGMMHVKRMGDDFYEFDEDRGELKGRRGGRVLRVGDTVPVRLVQADPVQGFVDFEPGWMEAGELPAPAPRASASGRPLRPRPGRVDPGGPGTGIHGGRGPSGKKSHRRGR